MHNPLLTPVVTQELQKSLQKRAQASKYGLVLCML